MTHLCSCKMKLLYAVVLMSKVLLNTLKHKKRKKREGHGLKGEMGR